MPLPGYSVFVPREAPRAALLRSPGLGCGEQEGQGPSLPFLRCRKRSSGDPALPRPGGAARGSGPRSREREQRKGGRGLQRPGDSSVPAPQRHFRACGEWQWEGRGSSPSGAGRSPVWVWERNYSLGWQRRVQAGRGQGQEQMGGGGAGAAWSSWSGQRSGHHEHSLLRPLCSDGEAGQPRPGPRRCPRKGSSAGWWLGFQLTLPLPQAGSRPSDWLTRPPASFSRSLSASPLTPLRSIHSFIRLRSFIYSFIHRQASPLCAGAGLPSNPARIYE